VEQDLLIRRVEGQGEIESCARLLASSEPWITLGRDYQHGLKAISDPLREVYVAVAGDSIAGFMILSLRGPLSGYIQTIAVMPEKRNQGIGRRLIGFAEGRIFRESPNVFLCVSSFNSKAHRFYTRLGYAPVGELKDYVVKGHSEILMRKTLGPIAGFSPGTA
jgi:ribosomal-protein-alanine N-acetyltransferase